MPGKRGWAGEEPAKGMTGQGDMPAQVVAPAAQRGATGSLAPTVLFPLQAGLALWMVGTWLRVGIRRTRA